MVGYWLNLTLAFVFVGLAVVLQLLLTRRLRPKAVPASVPLGEILRSMPRDLRRLLSAEIFIRWGDWFARDFARQNEVGDRQFVEYERGDDKNL